MFPIIKKTVSALFISTLLTSAPAFADIIISGTRIIYNADKKDVNVRLENKGNRPLLIQNWLDTGDDNADPSQIKVPFTSTPPVSRIESKRGQTVKVMFTGTTQLPADRESVFCTRIKLFYRPSGLKGEPAEAPAKLTWKLNNAQLQVNNPTPYYVSFNDVAIESGGKSYKVDSSMVAPFGQVSFAVTDIASSVSSGKVIYKAINDYGGNIDGSTSL